MRHPLTNVPLVLDKSRSTSPSESRVISACSPETVRNGKHSEDSGSRQIRTGDVLMAISVVSPSAPRLPAKNQASVVPSGATEFSIAGTSISSLRAMFLPKE